MIVRVYNGKGIFGVILKDEEEEEAQRLFDRMLKEYNKEHCVVEILDSNLTPLKTIEVKNESKEAAS